MTRIKLCGLMEMEDVSVANRLMPEYVGFIFVKASKRYRSIPHFEEMSKTVMPGIKRVGVFKDNDIEEISDIVRKGMIDIVQLHGGEDEDYIKRLHNKLNVNIIKAFALSDKNSAARANISPADMILLDSPGGGSGEVFDHSLLSYIQRNFFLAGGLTPDNVGEIAARYRPFAVDVSSGTETDGVKDPLKMQAFVEAVRRKEIR